MQKTQPTYEFKDEALPFIVYDQEARCKILTDEARQFLQAIPQGPNGLGVVAVAGMYRTGKSYLLNRMLLNRSDGFGVGPTINPCTKGLWVWGRPLPGQTPDGDPIQVLIVDTEGLGALDEDSNHDVRIFSLAILLSSFFIYNSVGSIDESALQNLSLVINLSKNIQIKSSVGDEQSQGEGELDEYGLYFPSFMWVVRDFTLQLIDQEGEPLTPKEYLEKALELQKGFSDQVEQKNRIRRLLRSFFKDRDCQTMIRPLTNEENLQKLASMDLEELRGDFVEQVLQLRRKVINRVKPKMLNGRKLSGPMLLTLAEAYVLAINKGAVPNIETAWAYICKNECQKAMEEGLKMAEERFGELSQRLPIGQEKMLSEIKAIKKEASQMLAKKAVGSSLEQYKQDLKEKLAYIADQLIEQNNHISRHQSLQFLEESYHFIELKLKNREYQSFADYHDGDLRQFQEFYVENGPPGPQRDLELSQFVQRVIAEAADFFTHGYTNEIELQKQLHQEHSKHLENQLKELKSDTTQQRQQLETKLREVELEKIELQAIEQSVREQYERANLERQSLEAENATLLSTMKGTYLREIDELRAKLSSQEQVSTALQRKIMQAESETDKDKALLEQKVEYLVRTIQELQLKDTSSSDALNTLKREHQIQQKEMANRYESQVRDLTLKLDEATEKLLDATTLNEQLETKYKSDYERLLQTEHQLKSNMSISSDKYQDLLKQHETAQNKANSEIQRLTTELEGLQGDYNFKLEEIEESKRMLEDEIISLKSCISKDVAIFHQKLEFKDLQNQQLQTQLEDTKRTHEQAMRALETKIQSQEDSFLTQVQIQEIKDQHTLEVKTLTEQFEQSKSTLQSELDSALETIHDLETSLSQLSSQSTQEIATLKSSLASLEQARDKALDQYKSVDLQKLKLLEEAESRHKELISQLEDELDRKESSASDQLLQVQQKSEEALSQLKVFYELEKDRLECRLSDERERMHRKYNQLQEEWESRLREEQQSNEELTEMLREDLKESDQRLTQVQQQAQHEIEMLMQRVQTLEGYLREKEERLQKEQAMSQMQQEGQLERYANERKELIAKVDTITLALSQKDRELTMARNKVDQLAEECEKRKRMQEEQRSEYASEKAKMNEKIENLRVKTQEMADQHVQRELEDSREIALHKQRADFQQRKLDEVCAQLNEVQGKLEERLNAQKAEFMAEINDEKLKRQSLKEQLESKYDLKRKQFKESEHKLHAQLQESLKSKAVLEEKLSHLDHKYGDLLAKADTDIQTLSHQLQILSETLQRERETFMHESDRLREENQEMDREMSELRAQFECEKALWENKAQFLEQQRDQAKQDQQEIARKFEMTMEQLQKRGSLEKDKIEISQQALLSNIEGKFKQQIREAQDQAQRDRTDYMERLKTAERENRALQTRIQTEQRDKLNEAALLQKKVTELLESEGRLQRELDEMRAERDRRAGEGSRAFDKEREAYRSKMNEMEQRCKEIEQKRAAMLFENEKERTRANMEKDQLLQKQQEMVEQVERLQKKAEDLLKENEKLRIDKNQQARKQTPINGALNRFASGMITPTARGMPTKENPVMQSQIFGAGKFETSSKPDPTQLPFTVRDNQSTYIPSLASSFATNIRARLGSPTQHTGQAQLNQQTLLKQSMLGGGMKSQGTLSLRSGSSSGNGTAKEGAINDEPQQQ